VKSTPTRGVKQFLKPDAYKQSANIYASIWVEKPWCAMKVKAAFGC